MRFSADPESRRSQREKYRGEELIEQRNPIVNLNANLERR